MNETSLFSPESITTLEQANSEMALAMPLAELMKSPWARSVIEERRELVRLATPLYIALHSSAPYYANRKPDDPFWIRYIGSRVTEARRIVAQHQALMACSTPQPTTATTATTE